LVQNPISDAIVVKVVALPIKIEMIIPWTDGKLFTVELNWFSIGSSVGISAW
jgi:hypothetical protein